jgi:hypothetical protein
MQLVGVRILAGLLWNGTWHEPGAEFDMPKDRATDLAALKPRQRDCPPDQPVPKAFLQILPELVGREITEPVAVSGSVTLDAGDNPIQPATLKHEGTGAAVDTLADCPHKDKLAALAVNSLESLQAMMTAHGDNFGKILKLAKDEAKAVSEWVAALPANG